jgi:hypothetical protein
MPANRRYRAALGLAALLAGCASSVEIPPGTKCRITSTTTGLYKYGPAQAFGPDQTLNPGTEVTMLQKGMGFSRVMMENGVTGYVASDMIEPLPPEPPQKPSGRVVTNRKLDPLFSGPVRKSHVLPTPGDPLFDVNDVPLPVQGEPEKPEFRAAPPKQRASTPNPEKKKDSLPTKAKE